MAKFGTLSSLYKVLPSSHVLTVLKETKSRFACETLCPGGNKVQKGSFSFNDKVKVIDLGRH